MNFWADCILHKDGVTEIDDRFNFTIRPNVLVEKVTLKGKIICSEYENWQDIELFININ